MRKIKHRYRKNCGERVKRTATTNQSLLFCSTNCYKEYWTNLYQEKNKLKNRVKKIELELENIKRR